MHVLESTARNIADLELLCAALPAGELRSFFEHVADTLKKGSAVGVIDVPSGEKWHD